MKCFWDYFNHGRLQVGEKAAMWSTDCKERQRRPERDHQVAVRALCARFGRSCNKLMYVGLVLLVRIVFLSIDFFCDTGCSMFSARDCNWVLGTRCSMLCWEFDAQFSVLLTLRLPSLKIVERVKSSLQICLWLRGSAHQAQGQLPLQGWCPAAAGRWVAVGTLLTAIHLLTPTHRPVGQHPYEEGCPCALRAEPNYPRVSN